MILVTGASGTVGRHVVQFLQESGHRTRTMTRARPGHPLPPGVDRVRADFDDPESLRRAVTGVHAVFLLTAPAEPTPNHDLALLAAARSAQVTSVIPGTRQSGSCGLK